jgi:hypothetical protein
MNRPVRIGNASAFYGDRLASMRALVDTADIDVITGDYLAELTMLILWKARQKNPAAGYARTFLTQFEQVAGAAPSAASRSSSRPTASIPRAWPRRFAGSSVTPASISKWPTFRVTT